MLLADKREIGNKLLLRRKQLGMTQEEVAEIAGMSGRTYADIERGNANMRIETALHICKALRMTPNEMLATDPQKNEISFAVLLARLERCSVREQTTAQKLLEVYLESVGQ